MAAALEIRNLRNITRLRFEIPDPGVWLLTAGNGAGKTTLLACLRRTGQSNAFPIHFPSSLRSERLDNHSEGTVTYEIEGETVEYAYRGERWTPRPRSNSHLFDELGYPSVIYVGATADRLTPRPEDFDTRNIRAANPAIIHAANAIFDTDKFNKLRTTNLTRGAGNEAFVLALGPQPYTYHSEKHFSLGELCVLKLLRLLGEVQNDSMIIVDELEMALHPRAQVNLLRYLQNQAAEKSLTVIFSTHSVTLLKSIDRRCIIYLDKQDDGEIKAVVGCFPTYAIGNIASDEETLPDIMLYVEDLFAREMVTAFFEKFADESVPDPTARPSIKIVPIGPFDAVVAFLQRNRSVLPNTVIQKAVLDADVATDSIAVWRQNNNHTQLAKFQRLQRDISFLPFTPEVGLVNHIAADVRAFEIQLRQRCNDNQIRIAAILRGHDPALRGGSQRRAAKRTINELIDYLEGRTQKSEEVLREQLCGVFANRTWAQHRAAFMHLFGPMLG
ncbi:AAA family ATPase [Henriciella algicola]|uniref:ATP-binding protein n=1 Tax=Henriciella algicola TaxID=1608422 RepID=A0A399R826_9PROT|nr:ATP-binding protein [Henriciella algicola]RIJ27786.1 ATP-binding protein [Henriciella algicola]